MTSGEVYADAQRQYEEDVRAAYIAWTSSREEAMFHYMERLAVGEAHAEYERDITAASDENKALCAQLEAEGVSWDNLIIASADLRELRYDQASDKLDEAKRIFAARVFPGR